MSSSSRMCICNGWRVGPQKPLSYPMSYILFTGCLSFYLLDFLLGISVNPVIRTSASSKTFLTIGLVFVRRPELYRQLFLNCRAFKIPLRSPNTQLSLLPNQLLQPPPWHPSNSASSWSPTKHSTRSAPSTSSPPAPRRSSHPTKPPNSPAWKA
jgi:hypothetical protein